MTRSNDTISVDITADGWRVALAEGAEVREIAISAAKAALVGAGPSQPVEVGVRLTGDAEIRVLNSTYRGRDTATNVLSFAMVADDASDEFTPPHLEGMPILLGDVVVAFETCAGEAKEQMKPLADHLRHMVVHGILHLLGYDHETEDEAAQMEGLECDILAHLGVPDPYARAAAQ